MTDRIIMKLIMWKELAKLGSAQLTFLSYHYDNNPSCSTFFSLPLISQYPLHKPQISRVGFWFKLVPLLRLVCCIPISVSRFKSPQSRIPVLFIPCSFDLS